MADAKRSTSIPIVISRSTPTGEVVYSTIGHFSIPVSELVDKEETIATGRINETAVSDPVDWEESAKRRRDELLKGTFS